jgi:putative DNA primase/helicase
MKKAPPIPGPFGRARKPITALVPPLVLPAPSHPMAVARELVKRLYTLPTGEHLRNHRGDFFQWDGTKWPELQTRDLKKRAYELVEHAVYEQVDDKTGLVTQKPFAPTQRKMSDLLDALCAVVLVRSNTEAPLWIDERTDPPASELVPLANGLLHVPTRTLYEHSTQFFNHHSLPFAFDPGAATADRWLAFLDELWKDDTTAIETLQEVIGYLLGGDTSQQKMFLLCGPKRGGKGTIGRVLTGLLGAHHVAAPTLASLSTNFGLSPLIGKPLALVSDARLSTKADSKIVVERLLSISGEDSLTIDRKYKEPWTGRLPTRFLIMTNELPRLSDASGALASRFIMLVLTQSFYNRENPRLTTDLLTEAPAIFNWALEGLDRLNQRGYFVNPESGNDAIQQMEDLSSPISAFLRERCIVGRHEVEVDTLWGAWKTWCSEDNRHPGTKAIFGRDLRAAVPTLKKRRPRSDDGERDHVYQGLGLVDTAVSGHRDHYDHKPNGRESGHSGHSDQPMYPPHENDGRDEACAEADAAFKDDWKS